MGLKIDEDKKKQQLESAMNLLRKECHRSVYFGSEANVFLEAARSIEEAVNILRK